MGAQFGVALRQNRGGSEERRTDQRWIVSGLTFPYVRPSRPSLTSLATVLVRSCRGGGPRFD
jgi:hypothetical protein